MKKEICKCGALDVTQTDHVFRQNGLLIVHGLYHCYTMPTSDVSFISPKISG